MQDHQANVEAQITEAWKRYVTTCLEHNADQARDIMRRIDALLDCLPRQREP